MTAVLGMRCVHCRHWARSGDWSWIDGHCGELVARCPACEHVYERPVSEYRESHPGYHGEPHKLGTGREIQPHETLRQLAPPGHIDHHRPAERPTRGTT